MAKQKTRTNCEKNTIPAKRKRGLNKKEPEAHNLAMRIKHILSLQQNKKQLSWTYWLAKDIYNMAKNTTT